MRDARRILVVDDEENIRRILTMSFDRAGWSTVAVPDVEAALSQLAGGRFDCVVTDVTMPGRDGFELQREVAARWPETPVVIMTAFGTIPDAVRAIRDGAFEYVTKPFDLERLKKIVLAATRGDDVRRTPRKGPAKGRSATTFVAESAAMKDVYATVRQVADSRATVLITGESGSGKEVVARSIHGLSPRSALPFVAVSCAALPETLLESELFGYEKGAFTGAQGSKPGRFELANGGTLFLDEVGEIPLPIQVKLLRVLQEREFERLGATQPTRIDVRLLTATNRDLQTAVEDGLFRLDLLYRLQVVEIAIPPLRERKEDILPLAEAFLRRFSAENGRSLVTVGERALAAMLAYPWPGNVRELENTMERAVVLAGRDDGELEVRHLPKRLASAA